MHYHLQYLFCIAFRTYARAYLTFLSIKFFTIHLIWLLIKKSKVLVKANIFKPSLKMTINETFSNSMSPATTLPFYFAFEMHYCLSRIFFFVIVFSSHSFHKSDMILQKKVGMTTVNEEKHFL